MNKVAYFGIAAVAALAVGWYYLGAVGGGSGVNVNVGDGVNVRAGDTSVDIGEDGVRVNTPGASVETGAGGVKINNASGAKPIANAKKNVVVVLDASGSMNTELNGEKKIDILKKSAASVFDTIKSDTNVAVLAYGHVGSNSEADKPLSCSTIEELNPLTAPDTKALTSEVAALPAKGWTPLAKSLEAAKSLLAPVAQADNEVLLISDGKESCGGNPAAVAKALCAEGVRVDVVGFDVTGADAEELKKIAADGCGAYASVNSGSDIQVLMQNGGLSVAAPGALVDIQGGSLKVRTDEANVDIGSDGIKVDAGDIGVETGAGIPDIKLPAY